MKTTRQVSVFILLLIGTLVLVNVVGQRFKFRIDLTEDGRYTLSSATTDLLENLTEAVTITGYFTTELPPDLGTPRDEFKDLLVEYTQRSGGNVAFEFIDPGDNDTLKQALAQEGIEPFYVNVPGKDKAEQLLAYMSVVVKMADRRTVIPIIQRDTPLEWTLSSAIKEVSTTEKPTIGVVTGHGEPPLDALLQLRQGLAVQYNVEPFAFFDTVPVHQRFRTLLIIDPADSINPNHLHRLDEFLASGRGVVIANGTVSSDLATSPVAQARTTDMNRWLGFRGVQVEPTIVTDAVCGQVQVMQQRGMFTMQIPVPFHYFPLIQQDGFGDHPVSGSLKVVLLQFASPMRWTGDSTITFTPLLTTSPKSNALPSPVFLDINKQWSDADFTLPGQVLGGALEGPFAPGAPNARMVVINNGAFCVNGTGQQMQQLNPDNVNLVVNAVDWVTDATGLIELRNKGVDFRPIDPLEEGQADRINWINLLLPVVLTIIYGLLRFQWRKRQRLQRMIPGHVR